MYYGDYKIPLSDVNIISYNLSFVVPSFSPHSHLLRHIHYVVGAIHESPVSAGMYLSDRIGMSCVSDGRFVNRPYNHQVCAECDRDTGAVVKFLSEI